MFSCHHWQHAKTWKRVSSKGLCLTIHSEDPALFFSFCTLICVRALCAQPRRRKPAFITYDNEASVCLPIYPPKIYPPTLVFSLYQLFWVSIETNEQTSCVVAYATVPLKSSFYGPSNTCNTDSQSHQDQ
jgi:hypothetical protein